MNRSNIKETANLAIFKKFLDRHEVLVELTVRRLYKDSIKYLSNIKDKNIHAIAASMIMVNLIESDIEKYRYVIDNPMNMKSCNIITQEIRKNIDAVKSIENKNYKKASEVEYITVVIRLVTEYFISKSKRIYTDVLLEELKSLGVKITLSQEYKPWRYITSIDKIIKELHIKDIAPIRDKFDDVEIKNHLELVSQRIVNTKSTYKIKDIILHDLNK